MDLLKKYNPWEIVVALLPPFFVADRSWHLLHDDYPSALYQGVSFVMDLAYCAILLYSFFCMYLGARQMGRFPKLMLLLLIALAARHLFSFVPMPEYDVIIRMFKEKLTVLAVTCTCMALAIPLLSTLVYTLMPISFANEHPHLPMILSQAFFLLMSLCLSVLFLRRNDFYKPDSE